MEKIGVWELRTVRDKMPVAGRHEDSSHRVLHDL